MIDFTSCPVVPGRFYNGSGGSKRPVAWNNEVYILKFPPPASGKRSLSHTSSAISEHLGSSIFRLCGIPAQETMLGGFSKNGKTRIVCACRDFSEKHKRFFDFCSVKNSLTASESSGASAELDDITEAISIQPYLPPSVITERFWSMFVIDALIGNPDRRNGNWGFLYDDRAGRLTLAPVYDCGSSLLPQADENIMRLVLSDPRELHARIFQFPTSAIKQKGRKINYHDFITGRHHADCNAALLKVFPAIDLAAINAFIDDTVELSLLQKDFYKAYITARYNFILSPAYQMLAESAGSSGAT